MKSLLIHIGTMKTGTSSIQQCLHKSSDILEKYGIYYNAPMHHNNHSFVPLFKDHPEQSLDWKKKYGLNDVTNKVEEIKELWRKYWVNLPESTSVISSELLSFYSDLEVKRLFEFLKTIFDEIRIIVYFRDPEEYILSMKQQNIKNGYTNSDLSMAEYFCQPDIKIHYNELIKRWMKVFGRDNIIVRPFKCEAFFRESLELDFFYYGCRKELHLEDLAISRMNESLNLESAVFLYELNKKYPTFKDGLVNKDRGLATRSLPDGVYQSVGGRKIKLPLGIDEERGKRLFDQVESVNRHLSTEEHIQYWSEPISYFLELESFRKEIDQPLEFLGMDYFLDLANEYNKLIEQQTVEIEELKAKLDQAESKENKIISGWVRVLTDYVKRIAARGMNLFQYYLFRKIPGFDREYYINQYKDADFTKINPLKHYYLFGADELRMPREGFRLRKKGKLNPLVLEYWHRILLERNKHLREDLVVPWHYKLHGDVDIYNMSRKREKVLEQANSEDKDICLLVPDLTSYTLMWLNEEVPLEDEISSIKTAYSSLLKQTNYFIQTNPRRNVSAKLYSPNWENIMNRTELSRRICRLLQYCMNTWDEEYRSEKLMLADYPDDIMDILYPEALLKWMHLDVILDEETRNYLSDISMINTGGIREIIDEELFIDWMNCYHKTLDSIYNSTRDRV